MDPRSSASLLQFIRCWLNFYHIPRNRTIIHPNGDKTVELSCDCGIVVNGRITFPFSILQQNGVAGPAQLIDSCSASFGPGVAA